MATGKVQGIRKGTKSCTECRRRKVRCIQSFQNAQTCRRCEERGWDCIAQMHTSGSTGSHRLSSKQKIAHLESKVLTLTESIRQMQQDIKTKIVENEELSVGQSPEGDWSDGDSSASEQPLAEQPFHLRLLFENDWLCTDGASKNQAIQGHGTTQTSRLLSIARDSLQILIPPKDDISNHIGAASEWLNMLQMLFPLPSGAKCGTEVVSCYEEMQSPNVDTMRLASWLLTVALILQQTPSGHKNTKARLHERERQESLSKTISRTVENRILAHDTLTCSILGVSVLLLFIRLEMGRGNIHKAWLTLRRTIAIAELTGLHNVVQVAQVETDCEAVDEGHISKVQLWDVICAADRLLGMVLSLPSTTSHYQQAISHSLSSDGIVQTRVYLQRLTNIANKIQDLDRLSTSNESGAEGYQFSLKLSDELKSLASQTPETWWSGDLHVATNVHPDHIIQFLHYYVAMRIHLPSTLRQGIDDRQLNNCLACVDACESMVQRYEFLCRRLPSGLFISEMLDLQVFSAAVTLLLISHMSIFHPMHLGVEKVKVRKEVEQVIKLFREKSDVKTGSRAAYNGFNTLCSLDDLLRRTQNDVAPCEIALNAPLIGRLQVRRDGDSSRVDDYWPAELLPMFDHCEGSGQISHLNPDANIWTGPFFDPENRQWDEIGRFTDGIFRRLL